MSGAALCWGGPKEARKLIEEIEVTNEGLGRTDCSRTLMLYARGGNVLSLGKESNHQGVEYIISHSPDDLETHRVTQTTEQRQWSLHCLSIACLGHQWLSQIHRAL